MGRHQHAASALTFPHFCTTDSSGRMGCSDLRLAAGVGVGFRTIAALTRNNFGLSSLDLVHAPQRRQPRQTDLQSTRALPL